MKKVRINYLLDAVIALAFLASAASGLAFIIMGDGGYQGGRNSTFLPVFLGISRSMWSDLHLLTSLVMITGVVVHVVLHWKWIVYISRQIIAELPGKKEEAYEVIV